MGHRNLLATSFSGNWIHDLKTSKILFTKCGCHPLTLNDFTHFINSELTVCYRVFHENLSVLSHQILN